MILVIILLCLFLLGLWLFRRLSEAPATRPTVFLADFHSGSHREIDRVTYLGISTGRKSSSTGAHLKRPSQAYPSGTRSSGSYAESKPVPCVACTDPVPKSNTFSAPCGDTYCAKCLITLFLHATKEESMYPPRCCGQAILLVSVRQFVTAKAFAHFARKAVEFETTDRTYCANSSCLKFVPLHHIVKDIATCSRCGKTTCSLCKAAAHAGKGSDEVSNAEMLLELAEQQQWQFCTKCHNIVQKNGGCNHMICRYSYHFCYKCGGPHRHCRCIRDRRASYRLRHIT